MTHKKSTYGILKYFTAVILLLSLLLLATACDKGEEGVQGNASEYSDASSAPQNLPWDPEKLDYIDNLFAVLPIEDDIGKYTGQRYEAPESEHSVSPIIFIPKNTIYDVRIFTINDDWADISDKKIEKILFETEKVTPQKPLIADIQFVDLFAVRGISFKDENGNEHFYEISDSPIDGSLIISKFKNGETEESQGGEESNSVDEIYCVKQWEESEDKKTIFFEEYSNGVILENTVFFEDSEKKIKKSETLTRSSELLREVDYKDGEPTEKRCFKDGALLYSLKMDVFEYEDSHIFGTEVRHTYDSSGRLLSSHYGKSDVYYLSDGKTYYLCYDDPSDPWDMKLYNGFTEFYEYQEKVADFLADEEGNYLSVKQAGEGYTAEEAEEIIKAALSFRDKIVDMKKQWDEYIIEE